MFKSRLSVKISLRLAVIAVPVMGLAIYLAVLNERATAREMLIDQGRVAAIAGAQAYSSILESALNSGVLTVKDVFEPAYELIEFPGLKYCPSKTPELDAMTQAQAHPSRDAVAPTPPSRDATVQAPLDHDPAVQGQPPPAQFQGQPQAPTDRDTVVHVQPPRAAPASVVAEQGQPCIKDRRYNTKYGEYTDHNGVGPIQDAILASSSSFIYASGLDVRGYVATPHHKYAEPPNGDPAHDANVARSKMKYDKPVHLAAAGYMGDGTLVQDYLRDTGEWIWDVVAPITVKGKHFGAFRVGVVKDRVHVQAVALAWALGRLLGASLLLLVAVLLLSTQRLMRPLVELSVIATQLSTSADGREFEKPIKAESKDEVGQMARSLERLRFSIKEAWFRLHLLDDALVALGLRNPGRGDSVEAAKQRVVEKERALAS